MFPTQFEDFYRQIVETANEGIWILDAETRTQYVNRRMAEMLGYRTEEMRGTALRDYLFKEDEPSFYAAWKSRAEERAGEFDLRCRQKDGSPLWLHVSTNPLYDDAGQLIGTLGRLTDLTERKRAEENSLKNEERYRAFVEQSSEGIWRLELEQPIPVNLPTDQQVRLAFRHGYLAECNDAMAKMYGYQKADEIVGARLGDLVPETDQSNLEYVSAFINSEYRLENAESHELDREGNPKFILNNLIGIVENGHLVRAWGTQRDITESKRAEQAMRESEQRYRIVAETASDAIISIDEQSLILFTNPAAERIFGYTVGEMVGQPLTMLIPEKMRDRHRAGLQRYVKTGQRKIPWKSVELSVQHSDGRIFPLEVSFGEYDQDGKRFFIGIGRDVSERKEIEKVTAHLAAIIESSDDAVISKDLNGVITSWNKGAEKMFGYTAGEAIGNPVTMLIPPHRINEEPAILERIRKGDRVEHYETVRRRKDGTDITLSLTVSPIRDESGRVIGASNISRDITENKRAQESLSQSQAILSLSMQSSRMGAWTRDLATETVWWSEELEEIFGLEKNSFSGTEAEFFNFVHEDDRQVIWNTIQQAIEERQAYVIEFRFYHTDGSLRWMEGRGQAVYSDRGVPVRVYGIGIDITERKNAEVKLRESEDRYRNLFESIDEGFCIVEMLFDEHHRPLDFRFVDTNPMFERQTGLKQVEGKTARHLVPNLEERWFEVYGDVALSGESIRFTEGSEAMNRWFDIYAFRVGEEESRKVAILFTDITERRRAEEKLRESEERFAKAFNSSPLTITITSLKTGKLIEVNETFVRVSGYSREEAIGRTTGELGLWMESEDREKELAAVENEGQINNLEYRFRMKDGTEIDGLLSAELIEIGGEPCALTVIQDITERRKTEEIVRQSAKQLALVTDTAPVFIAHCDAQRRYKFVNKANAERFGLKPEDFIGKTVPEVLGEEAYESIRPYIDIVLSGEPVEFETEVPYSAIGKHYMHGSYVPEFDESGSQVIGWVGAITDITDRIHAQEALIAAERRAVDEYQELLSRIVPLAQTLGTARDLLTIYRAVLEFLRASMPCMGFFVSFCDAETKLRRAAYVWGEGEEIDAGSLPPIPLGDGSGPNSRAIRTGKTVVFDRYMERMKSNRHILVGEDNGLRPNSSLVSPMIVMNRIIGTLEVQAYEQSAYTSEHIVALEMVATLAAVAIENVRLLQVEAEARKTAEAANRAKDEFLSVLSHELRTPLNSMLGWVRMLRTGMLDEDKSAKAIEVIERNTLLQNNLIEDLLDVSRIISGKMRIEKERIDLVKVFTDAVDILRPVAAQKNISFEFRTKENSLNIDGDTTRLQQVISNLVQNAIKFTPEGGSISVVLESRGSRARLIVKDTGIGISREILPFIFERFRQADSSTKRMYSGLGLGLTIVRNLVSLHGGRIYAESAGEGQGTTFTIELPLTEEFPGAEFLTKDFQLVSPDNGVLSGAKILLVDDDIESIVPLQIFLEREKAEIVLATSAKEALEKLAASDFHVLITDIGMPVADGYDLIARVRQLQTEHNAFITAIALTAYASSDDRRRALAAGFQRHFAKPVNYDELLSEIKSIYEQSK